MKKILLIALAVLPVLFACSKSNTNNNEKPSDLTLPKWAEHAAKVVLKADDPATVTTSYGVQAVVSEIDFMRSGRYVAKAETETKATVTVFLYGTYDFANGAYALHGDLETTVSTSGNNVTVAGETHEGTVTSTTVTAGTTEDKLCRTWKLGYMILKDFDKLGSAGIRVTSVSGLVSTLKGKGVNFDSKVEERVLQHEIDEISLGTDMILVTFSKADPFVGTWKLNGGTSFSYDFKGTMNGDVLSANASGTLEFSEKNVTITMNITSNNKDLGKGTAILNLVEKQ